MRGPLGSWMPRGLFTMALLTTQNTRKSLLLLKDTIHWDLPYYRLATLIRINLGNAKNWEWRKDRVSAVTQTTSFPCQHAGQVPFEISIESVCVIKSIPTPASESFHTANHCLLPDSFLHPESLPNAVHAWGQAGPCLCGFPNRFQPTRSLRCSCSYHIHNGMASCFLPHNSVITRAPCLQKLSSKTRVWYHSEPAVALAGIC